jgi:hypothetical protein
MSNFKHNKLRNTGLLFEFLLRQVTVDVLNKKKDSVALKIIKKKFNENTEMGKELALYNLLIQKKFKSESKADYFLSEVLRQRSKLSTDEKTESYFIIVENITTMKDKRTDSYIPNEMKDKDLRILSYKVLLEKFNKKYTNLTSEQKKVLKEYISNISNTNDFNAFVKNQLPILENRLNKKIKKVKDKILKIKLHEAVNCIGKFCLTEGKVTEDKSIVQLLRYYELDKELNKI